MAWYCRDEIDEATDPEYKDYKSDFEVCLGYFSRLAACTTPTKFVALYRDFTHTPEWERVMIPISLSTLDGIGFYVDSIDEEDDEEEDEDEDYSDIEGFIDFDSIDSNLYSNYSRDPDEDLDLDSFDDEY
jgi:hypothetical protein